MSIPRSVFLLVATLVLPTGAIRAQNPAPLHVPEFSTAGFFQTDPAVRSVTDFNPGWRFFKGEAVDAERPGFDDSDWRVVNLPDGLETLPLRASGSLNYQGVAWYRKHFTPPAAFAGRRVFLHFEAIMGKSKVWLNGQPIAAHFGGYLPIHIDVTDQLRPGKDNVVCVRTDNADDPAYPPGKPQGTLDFTYFGGIYRDVWLIATGPVYVTDANAAPWEAGGGVRFHTAAIDAQGARAEVHTHLANATGSNATVTLVATLLAPTGETAATASASLIIPAGAGATAAHSLVVAQPALWHPDRPNLYRLQVTVRDARQNVLDTLQLRVGLRRVELRGPEGLFLNGEKFPDKLVGGNRHQDFAFVGNALPNLTHWRDAKKLRDAGMRIIRSAHYPQDPAFMDACDELGLFVIVPTPGWQFFREGVFAQRCFDDMRQMVRRDRNRACLFAWEPILNETPYPANFAATAAQIVREEDPAADAHLGCDSYADAATSYDLMYGSTATAEQHLEQWRYWGKLTPEQRTAVLAHYRTHNFFVREFGDNVNEWTSQDSTSRIEKGWGEAAQLVQLERYTNALRTVYRTPSQDIGGCLWHPFDHQRGYHPDPFWGGLLDATRQPKYSYYVFMAQRDPALKVPHVASGPFVKIVHQASSVSPADVRVVSNCEEIRLTVNGTVVGTQSTQPDASAHGLREPAVFAGAYAFQNDKTLIRANKAETVGLVAEGLIGGRVVATEKVVNAGRRERIFLQADFAGAAFVADGSDLLPIVASVTDASGRVKRLGQDTLQFTVAGQATLVGGAEARALGINPQTTAWGEAVVLIRSTTTAGAVTIHVEEVDGGKFQLAPATLTLASVPVRIPQLYAELPAPEGPSTAAAAAPAASSAETPALREKLRTLEKELNQLRLKETERTQAERATDR